MYLAAWENPAVNTQRARAESYTSRWPLRAGGELAGAACSQLLPSYSQVSLNELLVSRPPNRTQRLRAESKAMAVWSRGVGATQLVRFCIQPAPSYSQVSLSSPLLEPPNKTLRPRVLSYANAAWPRTGGATGVTTWYQLAPSYSHVSLRPSPPNNTTRPRAVRSEEHTSELQSLAYR